MARRSEPILFDAENATPAAHAAGEEDGIERRRFPRVRMDAEPEPSQGDRRQADRRQRDRRSVDAMRAEINYTYNNQSKRSGLSSLLHKTGLKPSRVLLLIVALGSGGVAAWLATRNEPPVIEPVTETVTEVVPEARTKVLVASQPIRTGQRLTAASLSWQDWPAEAVLGDYVTFEAAPEAIDEMNDAVARSDLIPGDPIREQKLVREQGSFLAAVLNTGMRGVSVTINAAAASGGFISPNDHVDVLLTRTTPLGDVTETIVTNVLVLAINSELGGRNDNPDNPPNAFANQAIATLALDAGQAEIVTTATTSGRLSLVLRSMTDFDHGEDPSIRPSNQLVRLTSPFWSNGYEPNPRN